MASGQGGAPTAAAGSGGAGPDEPDPADSINHMLILDLVYIWVGVIGAIAIHRLVLLYVAHTRKMACLGNEKQRYFAMPESKYAAFKRYVLDSPIFRKRHNREFMLSSAVNVGTLPTRLQTIFIIIYYGINIAFTVILLPYGTKSFLDDLRDRAGNLATLNMIPLLLMAGRNNILIWALDISFDTYNLLHRWLGRLVVLEAATHAIAWSVATVEESGWAALWKAASHSQLILTGTISVCAFGFLMLHSPSLVRHAYYETFLHAHILVALTAVIVLWMHLDEFPGAQNLLLAALVVWGFERFMRVQNLVRNNIGAGGTLADIQALPGDAMRVTLRLARPWKFKPGQHVFLYIPTIGWWTNHPFSLAWSSEQQDVFTEKGLPLNRQDVLSIRKTSMSLIIRRRTGFTDKLWAKAEKSLNGKFSIRAFVEGPYGSQDLSSYGTVLLFAAGVGITHQVPFLRSLVADYSNSTGAVRRVTLVWIIQSPEHLEWIRPWMTDILGMEGRRDVLRILLFITRPRSTKEIQSLSASVQMFPGKPDVNAILAQQQQQQVGAMAVTVCGTGSLSDDVRRAVRLRCQTTTIDFIENAFSW
ncbi:hypothetical protein ANO11243_028350 [Dothideomycetidae sp. 11243]|nr:hypothetical protein ANO11243_028350 [fungal sp. No.11243]